MNLQVFNPLRWRKSFLFLILGGFVLVWFSFIDTYSLWTRYQLSQRKNELIEKTKELEAKTATLKLRIEKLKSDPALLERIAREDYGMRKKGETVYKIRVEE